MKFSVISYFSNNLFNPEMRPNYSFMLNYLVWVFGQENASESLRGLVGSVHGPLTKCPFHFALANLQAVVQRILQILYAPTDQFNNPPESCLRPDLFHSVVLFLQSHLFPVKIKADIGKEFFWAPKSRGYGIFILINPKSENLKITRHVKPNLLWTIAYG